VKGSD